MNWLKPTELPNDFWQECFLAHWLIKNPDADLSKVRLNHGFKGDCYEFWVSEDCPEYTGRGKYGPLLGED